MSRVPLIYYIIIVALIISAAIATLVLLGPQVNQCFGNCAQCGTCNWNNLGPSVSPTATAR